MDKISEAVRQDGAMMRNMKAEMTSRWSRDGPKRAQDGSERARDGTKSAPREPEMTQREPSIEQSMRSPNREDPMRKTVKHPRTIKVFEGLRVIEMGPRGWREAGAAHRARRSVRIPMWRLTAHVQSVASFHGN